MTTNATDVQELQKQLERLTLERDQAYMLLDATLTNKHNSVFLIDLESGLLVDRFVDGRSAKSKEHWNVKWDVFWEHILRAVPQGDVDRLRQQFCLDTLCEMEVGISSGDMRVNAYMDPITGEKTDEAFWYTIRARVTVASGKPWATVLILDHTEEMLHRQMQLEVYQDAMERAQKASESKSAFLLHMSHDIRTPMNAILGFASLARSNIETPKKADVFLRKLETAGEFLLRLLNDIMDMVRIESGKVFLSERSCSIYRAVENMDTIIAKEIGNKGLHFSAELENVEHLKVDCDPLRINQVIMNLLSNAIRFTKPGGRISFRMRQLPCERPGFARLEWRIKDNGVGIDAKFLPRIFEPFEREIIAGDGSNIGSGLGLCITKRLVELMHGQIQIFSTQGVGTEAVVCVDLHISEEEQKPCQKEPQTMYDFRQKRVLLAEDNELNCELGKELLESVGFQVETAADGAVAVEKLVAAGPGYYDLILMDIQMPYMDGYMATQAIRKMENPTLAQIPIVAMTANAMEQDRRKALDTGMNGYMAKPIDLPRLLEILQKILQE
ncbi:MAG: response regulator [Lachnospiraceae bacterium]|nr:response regulator [Lachnospiraceae bacterium]